MYTKEEYENSFVVYGSIVIYDLISCKRIKFNVFTTMSWVLNWLEVLNWCIGDFQLYIYRFCLFIMITYEYNK